MTTDVLEGKWEKLKGNLKEQWGKLTDDEILMIQGRRDRLEGLLQEKYGYTRARASQEVDNYLEELDGGLDKAARKLQETMHEAQARLAETKEKASQKVQETVQDAQTKLAEGKEKATEMAGEYNQRIEEAVARVPGHPAQIVHEYPWLVLIAVMLIGVGVGLLLRPPVRS